MPEYAPGTPLWVDVFSNDLDRTRAFYTSLFGWESYTIEDPQAGGYTMFYLNGKTVGAATPMSGPDGQAAWATYICAADADATSQAIRAAGGQVLMGPDDVMGQGRMVAAVDPTGAHFNVWQPLEHRGAQLVNEAGGFCWNELYTRDLPTDREFYRAIFGWEVSETDEGGMAYTLFQVDGRPIAGGLDMSTMLPDTVPPHWLVYFAVGDTVATLEKARELGATVLSGPMDTPQGTMAVLQDPVGAVFAVIQVMPQV